MERKKKNGQGGARESYVWDPDKLTWVEAPEKPKTVEDQSTEGSVAEVAVPESTDAAPETSLAAEAVPAVSQTTYGGALIRIAGIVIDLLILFLVMYVITRFATNLPRQLSLVFALVYFVGFWTWRGQTPGKILIGTRVVKADGNPIDVGRAVLRYLFYFVPAFGPVTYYAGSVSVLLTYLLVIVTVVVIGVSKNKRGIHDLIAGTYVIYTRAVRPKPEPAPGQADAFSEAIDPDLDSKDTDKQE